MIEAAVHGLPGWVGPRDAIRLSVEDDAAAQNDRLDAAAAHLNSRLSDFAEARFN